MSDTDKYRKGYEDMKKKLEEIREDGLGDIPENVIKGLNPVNLARDFFRSEAEEKGRIDARDGKDFDPPEKKSSGCFLTTACITALGGTENCRELVILRRYRDSYLSTRPDGAATIDHYYTIAPRIITAIRRTPNPKHAFESIYTTLVAPAVDMIEHGEFERAFTHYRAEVIRLEETYSSQSA